MTRSIACRYSRLARTSEIGDAWAIRSSRTRSLAASGALGSAEEDAALSESEESARADRSIGELCPPPGVDHAGEVDRGKVNAAPSGDLGKRLPMAWRPDGQVDRRDQLPALLRRAAGTDEESASGIRRAPRASRC